MIVRTISQLPSVIGKMRDASLIEVSEPISQNGKSGFVSKKQNFQNLKADIYENTLSNLNSTYHINDNQGRPININVLNTNVNNILNSDISLSGEKTFEKNPLVQDVVSFDNVKNNALITKSQVNSMIRDQEFTQIGPQTGYNCAKLSNDFYQNGNQLMCKIHNGERQSDEIVCDNSGNLVMYGWFADNGNVAPQDSWIGLFGYVRERWILLQLNPWIQSTNSSILQYCSFNVPVKKGLRLKVVTGFRVNGTNAGSNWGQSLALELNTTNMMVGYILYGSSFYDDSGYQPDLPPLPPQPEYITITFDSNDNSITDEPDTPPPQPEYITITFDSNEESINQNLNDPIIEVIPSGNIGKQSITQFNNNYDIWWF